MKVVIEFIHIYLQDGTCEQFYGKLNQVDEELNKTRKYFLRIHQSYLVSYDCIKKMNFSSITLSFSGNETELKISEDRQKKVRQRLCEIAGGRAVTE